MGAQIPSALSLVNGRQNGRVAEMIRMQLLLLLNTNDSLLALLCLTGESGQRLQKGAAKCKRWASPSRLTSELVRRDKQRELALCMLTCMMCPVRRPPSAVQRRPDDDDDDDDGGGGDDDGDDGCLLYTSDAADE